MIGIYKITSPSNKIYIGQSIDIDQRFYQYKFKNCKNQIKLFNSFNKYTIENHIFEIIQQCEISTLNNRERYYQELFDSVENGLNCKYVKSDDKSGKLSDDTKDKLRKANLGKKSSLETCLKISNNMKGRKLTSEWKLKIGKSQIGKVISKNTRLKQSLNNNMSKKVINIITGEQYLSISDCSIKNNIKYHILYRRLRKKDYEFKILENEQAS